MMNTANRNLNHLQERSKITFKELMFAIYLYSVREILSSPPKQKNTGIEQVDSESCGREKDPNEQQLIANNEDDMGRKKDVATTAEQLTGGCNMIQSVKCINVPTMVTGGFTTCVQKPDDGQRSQSSCSPVKIHG
ncbi:hypothetical protein F511_10551 [Dorcoceras hygrometricum]|uniref:Uncharacterized protein n=1 Tax=Dorcoceras hygrometricum TaxID=472368 RepID=A0A2Z7CXZ0_9LAMI|nr:hypothetical protein F511_10551 [Dorcoceras hygrometricum]